MSFEISFIYQNIDKFFSAESERRKINNQIANTSNWAYSNWLDVIIPAVKQK